MNSTTKQGVYFLYFIIGIITLHIIISLFYDKDNNTIIANKDTPVEESVTIDSLAKSNTTLLIELNNIDSIKNAKVIEVKTLDNDSTVKLFYKLLGK